MHLNFLENSKTRKIMFNTSIAILALLMFLGFGLTIHGIASGEHFLNESGNLNVFSIINVALDFSFYVVGFVLFISLGFEPVRKNNHYLTFMILIVSIMLNLFIDTVSWFSNGIERLWRLTFATEVFYYCISYLCVTLLSLYIIIMCDVEKFKTKNGYRIISLFLLIMEIITIIASFTGNLFYINEKGFYEVEIRNSVWMHIPMILMYDMMIYVVIISKKNFRNKLTLLITIFSLLAAFFLESAFTNLQLVYGVMMVAALVIMCTIHLSESVELESKKAELNNQKLTQMMNQIQPHFIYNVLSSIYYLCDKDGARAKTAINDFAKYLRINVDSVNKSPIVPFKDELDYCKTYLSLEKMRFDDELNIEYDIATTEFEVPSFSVQPLVENAVKHGVSQKEGGGTVKIDVKQTMDEYIIKIIDDGVGFDDNGVFDDGRNHVGLQNVRYRIEALTGGKLSIKSEIGKGTTSEIIIPKEK